jgi:hypothetical protein
MSLHAMIRSQWKRPGWILVLLFTACCFYTGLLKGMLTPQITMSVDLPLLGPERTLVSIGEWGRAVLLSLELWIGIPLSALIGFLVTPLFTDEVEHADVLWSTARAGRIPLRSIAAGATLGWLCVVVGSLAVFLNPDLRIGLSLAGGQWIPLWLALAWFRIAVWTAIGGGVFYLTRSRWAAIGALPLVQMAWFLLAATGATGLVATVHRELLAWGFISPYAPLGINAIFLLTQAAATVGLVVLLSSLAMWARYLRSRASSPRMPLAILTAAAGVAILTGSLFWHVGSVGRAIAPVISEATSECPTEDTLWAGNGELIQMPGVYSCLILPSACDTPAWFSNQSTHGWVQRYDEPLSAPSHGSPRAERVPAVNSLVLGASVASHVPAEFAGYIEIYRNRIQSMMDFASWLPSSLEIVLVHPAELVDFGSFAGLEDNRLLVGEATLTRSAKYAVWDTAAAFAAASGLGEEDRIYLTLVLVNLDHPELVENAVQALNWVRTGERRSRWPYLSRELRAISDPEVAARILAVWDEGVALGHAERVEQLVERRYHDSD